MIAAKRWRDRDERWTSPADVFNPARYGVEPLAERDARRFVVTHHYSGSYPAARLAVGLYRSAVGDRELAGVAVFSVPMNQRAVPRYTGLEPGEGVELGRFVLLPDTGYNAETWFLARAFEVLRAEKPGVRGVISYADPLERRDPVTAALTKPAHAGIIYQAHNARFGGRSSRRTLLLDRAGRVISPRTISKIRLGERGIDGAIRQLVAAGAPARAPHDDVGRWLDRSLATFERVTHPGCYVYAFGLDRAARVSIGRMLPGSETYPKIGNAHD